MQGIEVSKKEEEVTMGTQETTDQVRFSTNFTEAADQNAGQKNRPNMKRKTPEKVDAKRGMETDDDEDEEDEEDVEEEEEEEESSDESCSEITVKIDRNILDCPICHKSYQSSLFQCQNGHVSCSQCCAKLNKKCNICSLATGSIRCLPLESVIKSIKIACRNSKFGCNETLTYVEIDTHEKSCQHIPCYCPLPKCTFRGPLPKLHTHFSLKHSSELWNFRYSCFNKVYLQQDKPFLILNGKDGCIFLLLNSRNVALGNSLSLVCIRPISEVHDLEYELRVTGGRGNTLHLKGSPVDMTRWKGVYPSNCFLFLPQQHLGPRGTIGVDVKIRKIKSVTVE